MHQEYYLPNHRRNLKRYNSLLMNEQRATIASLHHIRLVYARNGSFFSFAELEGVDDRLSDVQIRSHGVIRKELGVQVEVVDGTVIDLLA